MNPGLFDRLSKTPKNPQAHPVLPGESQKVLHIYAVFSSNTVYSALYEKYTFGGTIKYETLYNLNIDTCPVFSEN